MRFFLFFLCACCTCCAAVAQPVLVAPDMNPVPGEVFGRHSCGVSRVSEGLSGTGVSWNFSTLSTISADTIRYLACSAAPDCDSFPGSSLATYNSDAYDYYIADAGRFALLGEGIDPGYVYYSYPQDMISYPMSFDDVKVNPFAFSRPAYLWFGYGVDTLIADGWGSLTLPSGVYSNVLRVHLISSFTDSNILSGSAVVASYRYDTYSWYTPGFHSPLLTMYYDVDLRGVPQLAQVYYYTNGTASLPRIATDESGPQVYPNPSTGNLRIKLNLPDAQEIMISLMDVTGREAAIPKYEKLIEGVNELSYNAVPLSTGIYLMKIQTASYIAYRKITVN